MLSDINAAVSHYFADGFNGKAVAQADCRTERMAGLMVGYDMAKLAFLRDGSQVQSYGRIGRHWE